MAREFVRHCKACMVEFLAKLTRINLIQRPVASFLSCTELAMTILGPAFLQSLDWRVSSGRSPDYFLSRVVGNGGLIRNRDSASPRF